MFNDVANPETQFAEMQALIAHAEATGWDVFFDRTDIPNTPAGIDSLWVRKHRYDPRDDLRQIRVPFLAILGGADRVVPPKENVPVLRRMLTEAGNASFRIVVLPEAGHGMEHGHLLRELRGAPRSMRTYYWKFDRVAPGVMQEIVDFLHTHLTFPE